MEYRVTVVLSGKPTDELHTRLLDALARQQSSLLTISLGSYVSEMQVIFSATLRAPSMLTAWMRGVRALRKARAGTEAAEWPLVSVEVTDAQYGLSIADGVAAAKGEA